MSASSPALALTPQRGSRLPDLALIGITLIWGATFIVVQTGLQWAGPFGFVALRFGVASLLALAVCWRSLRGLTRAELGAGVLTGLVLFGSYGLQTMGLTAITSSKSAFLTGLYVPLVPLVQLVLFRHLPGRAAWCGIGIAFVGLALLSNPSGLEFSLGKGEWLTIAGAAMISLEISLIGRFAGRSEPRRIALVQLLTVSLLSLVAMGASGEALPQAHPMLLACVLGMGAATALIQIVMNWAQKTVPATRATIIYAMEPVWAGLIGWLAGEHLSVMMVGGAALVVASVLISQLGANSHG